MSQQASTPQKGRSLFVASKAVHPRAAKGKFRTLKNWTNTILLTIYFVTPWLRWNRGEGVADQAILLDMSGRRGYFFDIEIWPQEVYYLTGILVLGAIGLFFATALFGRVWCGFTCIQTVFTDVFVAIERFVEGDRNARIRLDKQPLSFDKIRKRVVKNVLWLVVALATSWTWLIYFSDAIDSSVELYHGQTSPWMLSMWAVFTASTFLFAGYAREQVCIYMCPWPRFQSAMFDEDSFIVTYEDWRGEPRGKAKRDADFSDRGDCVDCGLCQQVCPTGIDIRDGSQLACIGCALCIDACNTVMEKFNRPPNLISYDSVSNQVARAKGEPTRKRLVRPRTVAYGVLLIAVAVFLLTTLTVRDRESVNVLHERSPLYVRLGDGSIRNGYTLKLLNMRRENQTFVLSVSGLPGAQVKIIGIGAGKELDLSVPADKIGSFRMYITAPHTQSLQAANTVMLTLKSKESSKVITHEALFAAPKP